MSDMDQNSHKPEWMSNTRSIVVIIQQIQKEPIAEAREVITRESPDISRVMTPTQRVHDTMSMQRPTIVVPGNTQSLSASQLPHIMVSSRSQESPDQADASICSERQMARPTVIRDYGDGSRELYERGSSSSPVQHGEANHTIFTPVPPSTAADWHVRNKRHGSSGESL